MTYIAPVDQDFGLPNTLFITGGSKPVLIPNRRVSFEVARFVTGGQAASATRDVVLEFPDTLKKVRLLTF